MKKVTAKYGVFPRPFWEIRLRAEGEVLWQNGRTIADTNRRSVKREQPSRVRVRGHKIAFTLAEILITLGIIGVVASLTLPILVKNHQRQGYVTQLRTVVNQMSQAVEKTLNDNNAINMSETKYSGANANGALNFLNDNFKIVQTCTTSRTPCLASSYKNLDGSDFNGWAYNISSVYPCVVLANGVSICLGDNYALTNGWDATKESTDWHDYKKVYVDVNGQQGPNIVGRDLFYMELYSDGKVADSYDSNRDASWACEETNGSYGFGCLSKIMNDGWKMDY